MSDSEAATPFEAGKWYRDNSGDVFKVKRVDFGGSDNGTMYHGCTFYAEGSDQKYAEECVELNPEESDKMEQTLNTIRALALIGDMSPDDRLKVFAEFCGYCGGDDPRCVCMRDE